MPNLKEVKNRIISVKSTQQITKAMKMVAAAKMRKAQDKIIKLRPYANKLQALLDNITLTLQNDVPDQYSIEREVNKVLVVAITSDRGLCGAFNTNVTKATLQLIQQKYKAQFEAKQVDILCIGNKGLDFFRRRNYQLISQFSDLFTRLRFDTVREAAEYAMQGFVKGQYDVVEVVYNEFKNVATQIVQTEQFLPIYRKPADLFASPGLPAVGGNMDYIFEPNAKDIVTDLVPNSLRIKFYKAVLESNAAEHGARMTAMDKATDNASELLKQLNLTYNRTRQAAITKEILEIVGGAEALSNG
jgi:F-type H+-transporting ATPase subunit gamma